MVQLIAVGDPAASLRATSSALACTWSSGTLSETSPMRSASSPLTGSQSRRWYFALAMPQSSGQMIAAWSPAATPIRVWPSMRRAERPAIEMSASRPDDEPGADGHAVHRRDDRLAAVDDVVDEVARLAEHPGARREVRDHLLDEIEVAARRERAAGAADDHGAGLGVGVDGAPHLGEVAVHGGVGRVEATLRLHRDHQDPVLGALEDEARK